jgi:hypothetical protein
MKIGHAKRSRRAFTLVFGHAAQLSSVESRNPCLCSKGLLGFDCGVQVEDVAGFCWFSAPEKVQACLWSLGRVV